MFIQGIALKCLIAGGSKLVGGRLDLFGKSINGGGSELAGGGVGIIWKL